MIDVNTTLAPANTVGLLLNCDADIEIGSVTSRLGRATIDSQLVDGMSILGLVQHVDQADSTKNKLFAVVNDITPTNADIWDLDGSPAISLADDTKNLRTYFLNYAGDTLRLNGTDAVKAYNSSTWITTGGVFDLGNMPSGYKYPKEFLDRVYLWGNATTPYRLYYSSVLTAGAVSWTSGQGYVDIEPEDNGGAPTGLAKVPGYVLIFKRRSMHRWNFSSAFPEALVNIGAYSQESILEAGGICAFYSDSNENEKGFYITSGDRPVCISKDNNRPIKKWVDAISDTATVAGYATETVFAWSVGNLTVDGETFSNVVLRYNRKLNQWSIHTYPTAFTCFAPYIVSGVNTIVGGDNDGTVYRINKTGTYLDATTITSAAFQWKVRQHFLTYGDLREKQITEKIIVRGKNLNSARVNAYVNNDIANQINQKDTIFNKILSVFGIGSTIRGSTIAIEVSGVSGGARNTVSEILIENVTANKNYV